MSDLRAALRAALTDARRARDTAASSALRSALAALENAEAVPVAADGSGSSHVAGGHVGVGAAEADRRTLGSAEESAILDGELAELAAAAVTYDALGEADRAQAARAGHAALAPFGSAGRGRGSRPAGVP